MYILERPLIRVLLLLVPVLIFPMYLEAFVGEEYIQKPTLLQLAVLVFWLSISLLLLVASKYFLKARFRLTVRRLAVILILLFALEIGRQYLALSTLSFLILIEWTIAILFMLFFGMTVKATADELGL